MKPFAAGGLAEGDQADRLQPFAHLPRGGDHVADAQPGPDLDFLRSLVPYVWARWH